MRGRLAGYPVVLDKAHRAYLAFLDARAPLANRLPAALRVRSFGRGNRGDCSHTREVRRVRVVMTGNGNSIVFDRLARVRDCSITIEGSDNEVAIGSSRMDDSRIIVRGDRNRVFVGDACMTRCLEVFCEDDGNEVSLSDRVAVHGPTELAAIEGTTIRIGRDCLFADRIHFRTGDSHAIKDLEGNRINPSKDIAVGDHVWVGMRATVLKGVRIPDSCVVAACAVVTKVFTERNCVIGGHPAEIIRRGIDWTVERGTNEP